MRIVVDEGLRDIDEARGGTCPTGRRSARTVPESDAVEIPAGRPDDVVGVDEVVGEGHRTRR